MMTMSKESAMIFQGSIVALVTPMLADGQIDESSVRSLIDLHLKSGTDGLVIGGTTGEGAGLVRDEIFALWQLAVEQVAGSIPVIAGIGSPSTAIQLQQLDDAMDAGVDGILAVTPYYFRTTQSGLIHHFDQIARHSDLPVMLYNVPSRTGNDLLPDAVIRLSEHQQVVAIKEACGDPARIVELCQRLPESFCVLGGDDATACQAVFDGATGVVSVSANVVPSAMQQMIALARKGQHEHARTLDKRLQKLHHLLAQEPNPIPVKAALALLGLIPDGLRLPLVAATDTLVESLRQYLDGDDRSLIIHP
jgi:4-hydroxy-tetrahydrodipicolinate synthase